MQIAFLSLFLGLVSGLTPIELSVQGPVAAVELLLDGRSVGRLTEPPWALTIDLGRSIEPHELVARALDDGGDEVARARQWLNVPRPPAEVEVVIEHAADGRPAAARLSWESLVGRQPEEMSLTFDGVPLPVGAGARAALPAFDPESTHVLSAELRFAHGVTARRDAVLGGLYGSEVQTELTALPVRLPRRGKPPTLEGSQGWFRKGSAPLRVVAVEDGPAQVMIVRDVEPWDAVRSLGPVKSGSAPPSLPPLRGSPPSPQVDPRLGKQDRLRFLWPTGRVLHGGTLPVELFDASRDFTAEQGGLHWLLTSVAYPAATSAPLRFADAVAVAGVQAAAGNRRRAVVLVVGRDHSDKSRYDPAVVRGYLESIGVPLYVWALVDPRTLPVSATAWGGIEDISSAARLRRAVARLREDLGSQRIVWLDGRHLPQEVTLAPAATVTKVGR